MRNDRPEDAQLVHGGKHLEFCLTSGGWEYVRRREVKGTVAIVAITDDKLLILTEQYRPPVGKKVIELPAGLAGDLPYQADEPLESAARRELKEETGYVAKNWTALREGPSSAGLTSETITFYYATGLTKMGEGGGDHTEDIRVHFVPIRDVPSWCADREREGLMVDFKIYAGLYLVRSRSQLNEARLWY
ncbi:MAG: NUDIX hydrolase [Verrucomicrobiae bacterium]|nr:NUDIX hydrolase [Verrucomicrobiae bacterium]